MLGLVDSGRSWSILVGVGLSWPVLDGGGADRLQRRGGGRGEVEEVAHDGWPLVCGWRWLRRLRLRAPRADYYIALAFCRGRLGCAGVARACGARGVVERQMVSGALEQMLRRFRSRASRPPPPSASPPAERGERKAESVATLAMTRKLAQMCVLLGQMICARNQLADRPRRRPARRLESAPPSPTGILVRRQGLPKSQP